MNRRAHHMLRRYYTRPIRMANSLVDGGSGCCCCGCCDGVDINGSRARRMMTKKLDCRKYIENENQMVWMKWKQMIVEAHKSQESHHLRLRNMAWGWLNGFCFHSTRIPFQPWHSRHKCVCIDVEHTPPPFIVHRICHCVRCGCLCVFLCSFVCLCRGWGVIEQCESLWDDCDTSHRHWMVVASHHTKSSMPFRWPTAKFIYNNEIATPEQRSKRKNMNPHTTTVIHVDYNLLYVGILLLLFHFFFFFAFLYYFVIFVFLHAHIGAQYIYRMFVLWLNI